MARERYLNFTAFIFLSETISSANGSWKVEYYFLNWQKIRFASAKFVAYLIHSFVVLFFCFLDVFPRFLVEFSLFWWMWL